jgi:hypothetical protein
MMTEKEIRGKLDTTTSQLAKLRQDFAKDPRYPKLAKAAEMAFVVRIMTLQEILGLRTWDEKEIPKNLKLDKRRWT